MGAVRRGHPRARHPILYPLGVLPCAANPHPADAYAFLRGPRYWADPGCDHNLTRVVSLSSTFPNAL